MIRLQVFPAEGAAFEAEFDVDSVVIGRSQGADLVVADRFLSRHHARLFRDSGRLMVEDLRSRNGTRLNGVPVERPTALEPGDRIEMCSSVVQLPPAQTLQEAVSPTEEERPPPVEEPALSRSVILGQNLTGSVLLPAEELLSRQAGSELATVLGTDELRRLAARLKLLNDVHQALASSGSTEELLELILDRVFEHLRPEEGVILLADDRGSFRRAATRVEAGTGEEILISSTLVHEVAEKGLSARVVDAQSDDRFASSESILSAGVRSLIAVPLLTPAGSLGMIALTSRWRERDFDDSDLELLTSVAAVAAVRLRNLALAVEAAERRRMEEELALARRIQVALLPARLPELDGYRLEAVNVPSRMVSGDYYQVVELEAGHGCAVLVADVSGKGMAASILTATLDALSANPLGAGLSPGEILRQVGAQLERRTPPDQFATAFLAMLDARSGGLRWASAGHNPALLVRSSGAVDQLWRSGLPLGLMPTSTYETETSELAPGDSLVVYTDGVTEATNEAMEEYGLDRLITVCRRERESGDLAASVMEDLGRFTGSEPIGDDRTLVVVRCLQR